MMSHEQQPPFEYHKWLEDNKRQDAQREHDLLREHAIKINEAAATSANQALRTALLINGGASVAMLAFIGGLVSNGKVLVGSQLATLAAPLVWFAIGVAFAGLATAFAYFTNYSNVGAAYSMKRIWEHPWHEETPASKRWMISYYICLVISVISGFLSLGLFVVGMYKIWEAILHIG
jgi:hypothetical protein